MQGQRMSPPIRSCGLDAFADLLQRFAFSQPMSTPARSIPDVRYIPRICSAVQQPGQYGLIAFLLGRTALRGSCFADGRIHRTQNLDHGQSVFVDATRRTVINISLALDRWQEAGQVVLQSIVRAESSPDVGMAAAQSFDAALEASVNGAGGGAARLDTSTAQALIRLAERSVTIQYLRDGLYQACQAYANGAITSTTYSLILGGIDETLATTMMAETAAGTVRAVNAAVEARATSSGDMPSGASGPGTADPDQPTSETADSGESGGASLQGGSTVAARTNQTATTAALPQTTTITMPPNAGLATEIARMHAAFVNDANFDSLMLACVAALDRPQIGGASFQTDLSRDCLQIANTEWLTVFSETSDRQVIALELASNQARALDAAAHACAPGGDGEVCKALRAALPSGSNSPALVQQVLSYARRDDQPTPLRTAAARP